MTFIDEFVTDKNAKDDKNINGIMTLNLDGQYHYYIPGKPIRVYCEDFLTDKKNGDFDTIGIVYALKTENGEQKKIEINRFFGEPKDNEERDWVEISKEEYIHRKLESERRLYSRAMP